MVDIVGFASTYTDELVRLTARSIVGYPTD